MHREISHTDSAFAPRSNLSLYLLTGLIGLLLFLDLWPLLATWLDPQHAWLLTWSNEINLRRFGLPFNPTYALVAAILGGSRALMSSLDGLFEGRIRADLALAVACVAAILLPEWQVAAEVVFIGLVGECLESITFERTERAIRRLVEVFPRRCWVLRDGQEVRVRTSELQVGDQIVVKPGARVPADGVVVEGRSALDTSALTGEALPVDRGPGDLVLAGSVNQFGALTIEARRVAEHTVAGQVIELTARALKDKAPLERTADRLARYFLPAVLALTVLTFLGALVFYEVPQFRSGAAERLGWWKAVMTPPLAVLVVACPCALILATPAAILAALGRLAGTGVLIKGGSALERLAGVRAFAFDKTGTLTEGRLELGDVTGLNGVHADEVLRVAATAEQRSEHVLARLLTQEARTRQLPLDPLEDFQAHPGAGIAARTPADAVLVGTRRLLEENGITVPPEAVAVLERLDATGQTALLVARGSTVLGVIGARDRVRPDAAAMLAELRDLGITDLALLTGDRQVAARAVAESLGISEVHAELLPQQKADLIRRMKENSHHETHETHERKQNTKTQPTEEQPGNLFGILDSFRVFRVFRGDSSVRVAMVGDGINDAPALACADVGLALGGSGTEVAAEAGDIVFMGDPLRHLPLVLRLSRETVRIIRQNILVFAFGVNAVGIVLTAWLWPLLAPTDWWYRQGPVAGVIYHQLASLAVLLNAMRLLWFARPATTVPRWRVRLATTAESLDGWMQRNLDVDEWLHWLGHHWRPVLAGLLGLLLLAYGLSGLIAVAPEERAVVRRFGRALDDDLGPGLHWRWPWPIEEVTRLQPGRLHSVEVGFRWVPGQAELPASLAWESPHTGAGLSRVPEEAVMITGDGNLLEMQASIRYTIRDPHAYLFEARAPEELLRAAAESVLREVVAGRPFLELLTVNRQALQDEVLTRLQDRLRAYGDGLGIQLDGLALEDLHPPQEVVPAYHEVTRAMEARDRQVNEATAQAFHTERKAQGQALQIVRSAEALRQETVLQAEAERTAFLVRQQGRSALSWRQEAALLAEAGEALLHGQKAESTYRDYEQRRREWMAVQATLTDFRLFWDMVGRTLVGRNKLIVDADKVPGRRQMLLIDPDTFRIPVPMMSPAGRPPPRPFEE